MIDFHVHCDYSVDALGSAEEYAGRALEKGLKTICFTTHCDLDPQRRHHDGRVRVKGEIVEVTSGWLGTYVDEIRRISDSYRGRGLTVRCGLEMGYTPGIEDMIERTSASLGFDFILGGVHTLDGVDIVSSSESMEYFSRTEPRQLCERYFHDVGEAVRSGLFDCIAHLDIYKRCGLDFYGEPLNVAHMGFVEPVLEEMARRDIAMEINSGGLRKGLKWPYPDPEILEAARRAGISGMTPGSDAHKPEQVGSGLEKCFEVAESAGFDRVVLFAGRDKQEIPIRQAHGR